MDGNFDIFFDILLKPPQPFTGLFFSDVLRNIKELDGIYVVLGGDFNVVQEPQIDHSTCTQYNRRSRERLQAIMEEENLVDIWRQQHEQVRKFTWHSRNRLGNINWSRIDYFLVSTSLIPRCEDTDIQPSVSSDHSAILISLEVSESRRGPGIWKMNNEMLQDTEFVENLKHIVQGVKRVYHDKEPAEKWELIKFEIAQYCKEYSKEKARMRKLKEFLRYEKLS